MPGTSIKDALQQWEERTGTSSATAKDIGLQFMFPPIEKMDGTLSTLVECRKLSLSSNKIEKIGGINGLKNLKILSLARNNLKNLAGIVSFAKSDWNFNGLLFIFVCLGSFG